MAPVDRIDPEELRAALADVGADGWLIYDFHNLNPVAARLVGYKGMVTRRLFLWLPASGRPTCIASVIDTNAIEHISADVLYYATWQQLHDLLKKTLRGKRAAMEISTENAVPYLDRVPAGVVALLTSFWRFSRSVRPTGYAIRLVLVG